MEKDELITGFKELIDETHGKPGHAIWINGRACEMRKMLDSFGDNKKVRVYAEETLRELGKSLEESK